MPVLLVSAACVHPGGPVRVRRIAKKSSAVLLDLTCSVKPPSSVALVPVIKPGSSSTDASPGGRDKRGHQDARSSLARKMETERKKRKLDKMISEYTAPLLREIKSRDDTIVALRQELARVSAASATVAENNWRDGVAAGRLGWGPTPTPRTSSRGPAPHTPRSTSCPDAADRGEAF